ncbi:hypothetical protein FRX31_021110 [Thalictrum thalictroides]|uniref:Uncharacterized protein n=1 Tax=Thalictrum thalictroides TaxID=46969 RepID=A0A7J6VY90_THATH|nr:hypothetical protein FRX31_021110 [Thalictrum thalictroides]
MERWRSYLRKEIKYPRSADASEAVDETTPSTSTYWLDKFDPYEYERRPVLEVFKCVFRIPHTFSVDHYAHGLRYCHYEPEAGSDTILVIVVNLHNQPTLVLSCLQPPYLFIACI